MNLTLLALLGLGSVLAPAEAPSPPPLALAWVGELDGCPTREEVVEDVASQAPALHRALGAFVPEKDPSAELSVRVEISTGPAGWRAQVELVEGERRSKRSFGAESCETLAKATALIVAVTLDPVAVAVGPRPPERSPDRRSTSEPAPDPETPPGLRPEPRAEDDPARPLDLGGPSRSSAASSRGSSSTLALADLQIGVSVQGGGGWGPSPNGHGALGGRLALLGAGWRAELGTRWALPRRIEGDGVAGSFDGWHVEARGCWVPQAGPFELPLCPGLDLGRARGRGVAPTINTTRASFPWLAAVLGQRLLWVPIDRLAVGAEAELIVPLTRASFVVGDLEVAELARLGVRAALALELRLP